MNVTVTVRAVNEAGPGPEATATARNGGRAAGDGDRSSATPLGDGAITVDGGGGQVTCALSTAGEPAKAGGCGSITMSGLAPGTSHTFTVTATNAAGKGTATRVQATAALYGTATCVNGSDGDQRTYCNADVDGRNGNEVFAVPRQDNDRQVGWAKPGSRLKAYCRQSGENVDRGSTTTAAEQFGV